MVPTVARMDDNKATRRMVTNDCHSGYPGNLLDHTAVSYSDVALLRAMYIEDQRFSED